MHVDSQNPFWFTELVVDVNPLPTYCRVLSLSSIPVTKIFEFWVISHMRRNWEIQNVSEPLFSVDADDLEGFKLIPLAFSWCLLKHNHFKVNRFLNEHLRGLLALFDHSLPQVGKWLVRWQLFAFFTWDFESPETVLLWLLREHHQDTLGVESHEFNWGYVEFVHNVC